MKANIHPKTHPVIFLDISTGTEFITESTLKSSETKEINGVTYFVIRVEISSASHPFYTGTQKLLDTAGRVDRFREKVERAQKIKEKKVKMVDEDGEDSTKLPEQKKAAAKKSTKK